MKIIDCTLRDGGYYNNWFFSIRFINKYLKCIDNVEIKYCELGFRFPRTDEAKGLTAYTDNNLLKKLIIPKKIQIGVMINASDFIRNNNIKFSLLKKIFFNNEKIKFVRIACHYQELFKIKKIVTFLKKNYVVMINLMQISEINKTKLSKISNIINSYKIKVFYVADSLGSLKPKEITEIVSYLKKKINCDLGIHAHDNLSLALCNTKAAINNGANWADSTICGMGRGAGNLKTEIITKIYNRNRYKFLKKYINENFIFLKKKYKWGTNYYYRYAANYRIHPTYIQNLLGTYKNKHLDLKKIILNLKNINAKKYNPFNLFFSLNLFSEKEKKTFNFKKLFKNKRILILGSSNINKIKKKIEKEIKKKKLFVITLNNNFYINKKLQNLRVICHPLRLLSLEAKNKNLNTPIIAPFSSIKRNIRTSIFSKKNKILSYGLKLTTNNNLKIYKNYLSTNNPLALTYIFSLLYVSEIKQVYLSGFEGYQKDDFHKDNSDNILQYFKKKIRFKKLYLN